MWHDRALEAMCCVSTSIEQIYSESAFMKVISSGYRTMSE
jgi:hypothetical protein